MSSRGKLMVKLVLQQENNNDDLDITAISTIEDSSNLEETQALPISSVTLTQQETFNGK